MENLGKYPIWLGVAGIALFSILFYFVPAFAMIGEFIFYISVSAGLWFAFDKYVLKRADTFDEIVKKRNLAYALVLIAYSIIILAAAIAVG